MLLKKDVLRISKGVSMIKDGPELSGSSPVFDTQMSCKPSLLMWSLPKRP